jgi:hypothetical protein
LLNTLLRLRVTSVDLVGHSLGGLVIYRMLENEAAADLPPGRVVLMGTPFGGSRAARALGRDAVGRVILGRGANEELIPRIERRWAFSRELGVIAGSVNTGLGRLVTPLPEPSDGTVAVEETRIDGMKEHLVMAVSHTAMVFSSRVAAQVAHFLQSGAFRV